MSWTKVLPVAQLAPEQKKVVKVGNQSILLVNHQNQFYAVANSCPHMKLPMQKGKLTADGAIICPWHRSAFDLCTGDVKDWTPFPPGVGKLLGMISSQQKLAVFPTRVEEDNIWVEVTES